SAAGNIAQVVRGAPTQTADLIQIWDGSNNVLAKIDAKGYVGLKNTAAAPPGTFANTDAGKIWYDSSGTLKYWDGTQVKSLGVAGAGITNINGQSGGSQLFANDTNI